MKKFGVNVAIWSAAFVASFVIFTALTDSWGYYWPSDGRARSAMVLYGIEYAKITKTLFGFGCAKDDKIHYKFSTIKSGRAIHGTICMSYIKAATVRAE